MPTTKIGYVTVKKREDNYEVELKNLPPEVHKYIGILCATGVIEDLIGETVEVTVNIFGEED